MQIHGDKELLRVKQKVENNKRLDKEDEMRLALIPFTSLKRTLETIIYEIAKIINKAEMDETGREFLKGIIRHLNKKFVPKNDQSRIIKEIDDIFEREVKKAIEESRISIAKSMIDNGFTTEQISIATNLSENEMGEL